MAQNYTRVDPKLLSMCFVHAYGANSGPNTKTRMQGSSKPVDRAQNEVCTLKLREVTPVYVCAVEWTPVISSVQRTEIKKERYAIQFCVRLGLTL